MPASVLLADRGESIDNFQMLADNGIATGVHEFGSAAGDIECIEDLPATWVRIEPRLVARQASGRSALIDQTLRDLIKVAGLAGADVTVDEIQSRSQADWWRSAGANHALGPFAQPGPTDLHDLM